MITISTDTKPNGIAARAMALPEYGDHEIANIFPLIRDRELADLTADIAAFGVREPIWLFEGKILDGRNRYRAAREVGTTAKFREFEGSRIEALEFVWSMNRTRRHLSSSQAAIADAERNKLQNAYADVKKEAKSRQLSTLKQNAATVPEQIPERTTKGPEKKKKGSGDTRAKRSKLTGVNEKYIDLADKLVETRPDLAEAVKQGDKTLTQVQRELKKEEVATTVKDLPEGKHRVIYADPPWQYNDTRAGLGSDGGQAVDRASTAASNHYPTMDMAALRALDVKSLAADDCILFLWATFPLLPEQIEVAKAWGFKYKTSFVWDKGRGSFGHYHNAEAELLLICTRGSCTPDAQKKERQVQRFARGEHSRKPEEFRALIDRLYLHGPRIELFRRGDAPEGWVVWGAEIDLAEAA